MFGVTFASPRTCRRKPLVTSAVVVVSARAPRVPSAPPHRRSRDRAHAPVDFALLVESPLLVLVDAPVDGGLHRRTGERARDAERGHADGSRHAPLRSERKTRASPSAGRVAWALALCRLFATARPLSVSADPQTESTDPGLLVRGFESFRKDSGEILTPRCSPPRRPHSRARAAAFPSARVPRSEVRPEPPTEVRRSVRGRLRPGRPAVRAKHQRGIRRARWATKTPSCPWATT